MPKRYNSRSRRVPVINVLGLLPETMFRNIGFSLEPCAAQLLSTACDEHIVDLFAQSRIGALYCTGAVNASKTITLRDLRLAQRLINR